MPFGRPYRGGGMLLSHRLATLVTGTGPATLHVGADAIVRRLEVGGTVRPRVARGASR